MIGMSGLGITIYRPGHRQTTVYWHMKQVLFGMCPRYSPSEDECCKNWDDSSSELESDAILVGFTGTSDS